MKKTIGQIMGAGGLIGVLYYGYRYIENSNTLSIGDADFAVTTGDYVPILVSAVIMLAGILISKSK